jgi:hypothetical protein
MCFIARTDIARKFDSFKPAAVQPDARQAPADTGADLRFSVSGVPLRGRPHYDLDTAPKSEKSLSSCNKVSGKSARATGGVFTFFCEHQFCYG